MGAQGSDLQSFLPFEAFGAWLRVTAAAGSWGFKIPAASAFQGIFQNKQLLWEWGGRDFGCVRLLFYKVLLFLAFINRAAGVSICFYSPCCAF